jgi:hypothetical protein
LGLHDLPGRQTKQSTLDLANGLQTSVQRPSVGERDASHELTRSLELSRWDFPMASSEHHITSLHPYPARFIPQIPRQAIVMLLRQTGVVWDPFAGAGTSVVEANAAGHISVGVDVNQLACLLQRVFTTPLTDEDLADLRLLRRRCTPHTTFRKTDEAGQRHKAIPRLAHWFSDGAICAVDRYLEEMQILKSERAISAASFALSRVLVRISRQESDTQYRATKRDVTPDAAWSTIRESLGEILVKLPRYLQLQSASPVIVRLGDSRSARTFENLPEPDLVLTSPPYPNAYEYWLYHKYRMFWLEMDPLWSRAREIGARPFYSGTGKLGVDDFRRDMRDVLSNITNRSTQRTKQFWVVGDSVLRGKIVRTAEIIAAEAEKLGWRIFWRTRRNIRRSRSSFQGIGRLATEEILILDDLT